MVRCRRHLDQAAAFSSTVSRGLLPERVLNPLHGRRKVIGTDAPKKMDGMALIAEKAPVDDVPVATHAQTGAMRHRAPIGKKPPEKVRDVHHPPSPLIAGKTPDEPTVEFRRPPTRDRRKHAPGLTIPLTREAWPK
jgi:hypothetical protein